MIRRTSMFAAAILCAAITSTALAEPSCKECPIAAAMKNLPQITYQIGEEQTQCRETAGKIAEKSGTAIVYLVGKQKFEDDAAAKLALADATEEFVANFAKPHTCKISGTTTIAGKQTQCSESAAKMTALLANAVKDVKQTYSIDGQQCDCPHAAAALAEKTGKPKLFVVGTEKTPCAVTARLNLARAKYRAMVEALAEAEKAETPESKS
ncbi:MAG: hypothetical protein KDA57_18615 [Planctomycetales bacterium]|nr:hypothetical protein [Planctomycetales bacterium]